MRQRTVVGMVAWLAAFAPLGCGNSKSSDTTNAAGAATVGAAGGGVGGSGTASGGAGSTRGGSNNANAGSNSASGSGGSGIVLGDSLTEACIAYVLAFCDRQATCGAGSSAGCLASTYQCPDLTDSSGSTRTVAGLQACAKAYDDLPCDQVKLGVLPACVTPGTRALGEQCAFSSQCSSLACSGEQACRSCVPFSHQGEPCSNNEVCAGNLRCTLGECQLPEATTPTPPLAGVGMACSVASGVYCQSDLYCDAATSKCAAFPSLGMSCAVEQACSAPAYCETDGLTCKALPGEGAPCGVYASAEIAGACASSLWCARSSKTAGVCRKPPQVGEACVLDPETGLPQYQGCDSTTARCDTTKSPPTCAAKAAKGEACKDTVECATDMCICADGKQSCDTRICGHVQYGDQPCVAPGDVCHPGFSCTAGVCKPRDSQGIFAAACGL